MLTCFKKFLKDSEAKDMFVTGAAGTGKTTDLRASVEHCIAYDIPYVVLAFTHKACGILMTKLPEGAHVRTLHSFLKKRPSVNTEAKHLKHVETNLQHGKPDDEPKVIFIDEYSMVGDEDKESIEETDIKTVWLGDKNQLPPVGDTFSVFPIGDYCVTKTKQYRNDNELQQVLNALISFIEKRSEPYYLEPNKRFIRDVDLVQTYETLKVKDKVLLAFTNERVQSLNEAIQGRDYPIEKDKLFSPSNKQFYDFVSDISNPGHCVKWNGEVVLPNSKYKTFETVKSLEGVQFADVIDEEGELITIAYVFGHYNYKLAKQALQQVAVDTNVAIEQAHPGVKAAQWCKQNYGSPLARKRAKAWREFLSFDDCVICIDFPHAMTVHKSQGSTYDTVLVDMKDISRCQDRTTLFKLAYVAISRASNKVYTS